MSETITIHEIVMRLLQSDPNLLYQKRGRTFAELLQIPRAESQQIIQLYETDLKSGYELLREFLEIWVSRQGLNKATIGSLSTLLEEYGLKAAAGIDTKHLIRY